MPSQLKASLDATSQFLWPSYLPVGLNNYRQGSDFVRRISDGRVCVRTTGQAEGRRLITKVGMSRDLHAPRFMCVCCPGHRLLPNFSHKWNGLNSQKAAK